MHNNSFNLIALFLFAVLLSSVMRRIYCKRMPENFKIHGIIMLIVVVSLCASFLMLIFSLLVESYFCTTYDFTNNLKDNLVTGSAAPSAAGKVPV